MARYQIFVTLVGSSVITISYRLKRLRQWFHVDQTDQKSRSEDPRSFGKAGEKSFSDLNLDECGICDNSQSANPILCVSCQVWNDAMHVFECEKPVYHMDFDVHKGHQSVPLTTLLGNQDCMVCSLVGAMVVDHLLDMGNAKQPPLAGERLRVRNCGPYLFDYRKSAQEEFGKPLTYHFHAALRQKTKLRCVVFVLLDDDPEAFLTEHKTSDVPGKWMNSGEASTRRSNAAQAGFGRDNAWPAESMIEVAIELQYEKGGRGLRDVQRWDSAPFLNIQKLRSLLERCEQKHDGPCKTPSGPIPLGFHPVHCPDCAKTHAGPCDPPIHQMPPFFRLVDCERRCVIEPIDVPRFVALSYAWLDLSSGPMDMLEKSNLERLSEDGGISESRIPAFILDAMLLCQDLGERYLWIDRLCIVQDDKPSKKLQIKAMDKIYRGASATIVVAADQTQDIGLPGVRGRPRRSNVLNRARNFSTDLRSMKTNDRFVIDGSRWNTRGWTLQEKLLSRRCIFISNHDAYFVCSKTSYQEELVYDEDYPYDWSRTALWGISSFARYCILVEEYTARELSHPSDILHALAGLGNVVATQLETRMRFSMPERFLHQALLWAPTQDMARREQVYDIPSWSWASWKGAVRFNSVFSDTTLDPAVGTLVRFHLVEQKEDEEGAPPELVNLDIDEGWFIDDFDFFELEEKPRLPKVRNIDFDMPISPADLWRACPHNPWSVFTHAALDDVVVAAAKQHPGALVFNSTSATLQVIGDEYDVEDGLLLVTTTADGQEVVVGETMMMRQDWFQAWLQPAAGRVEAVVICAGSYPRTMNTAQHRIQYYWRQAEKPYGYVLYVLLVARDAADSRLCRRVAVACVDVQAWERCAPRWGTIALI
nr:hypothetical protein CFP56_00308 [Quercus suber]